MICKECNSENKENAKFCANCGKDLKEKEVSKTSVKKEEKVDTSKQNDFVKLLKEKFVELKDNLIKPLDSMKNKSVDDIKSVAITGVIISLVMMLVHLISSMISSCHVMKYDWLKGQTYSWSLDGLKNVNYFDATIKSFVIYALVMLVIAAVFYVGSLIIKKSLKFSRVLSIVFVSIIPVVLGCMIVSPILGLIYIHLGTIAFVLSFIYSISIFTTLLNEEIKLDGTLKLYYNTVCYSVLILVAYFIAVNSITTFISSLGI